MHAERFQTRCRKILEQQEPGHGNNPQAQENPDHPGRELPPVLLHDAGRNPHPLPRCRPVQQDRMNGKDIPVADDEQDNDDRQVGCQCQRF